MKKIVMFFLVLSSLACTLSCGGKDKKGEEDNTPVYAVGDAYPDATNPVGVVAAIDQDGKTGKIVSLIQHTGYWSTETTVTGITSQTDGAGNTANILAHSDYSAIKYPIFAWCASLGSSWYIPAPSEIKAIRGDIEKINAKLATIEGATTIDNARYWSSCEASDTNAKLLTYIGSIEISDKKISNRPVRVMMKF